MTAHPPAAATASKNRHPHTHPHPTYTPFFLIGVCLPKESDMRHISPGLGAVAARPPHPEKKHH
ncbi:hypothetical protein EYF80_053352 [Liparis tanakae]|uniref:Uncharacterized protein n=1 Tax=Liparis tanakae TaxID=230148 RepID=A0A4Z2F6R4_9TELE|nr:hypothetical protein EYF80_053352 [Liparis tanakae]